MLTNPTTLGLFEKNILEIADIVHAAGGLMYYDGANLNAVMGVVRPGIWGSTSCTSICTRRFPRLTAAAVRGPAPSASNGL